MSLGSRGPVYGLLLVALMLPGCISYSPNTIRKSDAQQPRDPVTGVLIGAEERTLGPSDAPTAVLFVSGFLGAGQNFGELPDRLASQGHCVRVIRLPGLGTSPLDFEKSEPDAMIEKVRSEVIALKADHERVFIVTHSMGAAISTIVVADEPVTGMVWGAPFFEITYRPDVVLPVEWWAHSGGYFVRYVKRTGRMLESHCPEVRDKVLTYRWIPTRCVRLLVDLGRDAGADETLSRINGRLLWIHPEYDGASSRRAAEKAYATVGAQEKRAIILENSDHHIYWDCDREIVYQAVEEFVRN